MSGRKRLAYRTRQTIDARLTNCRQHKAKKSRRWAPCGGARWKNCAGASQARPGMVSWESTAYPVEEQGDSTCVTTVPPKWPMTAWGTACGDYFRVTTRKLGRLLNTSAFQGADPETRDSNPAGLGPWFHRSQKAREVGQPSSVIRSALQDQAPPVALQPLLLPSNIETRLRRLHTTPHCIGPSRVSHG